MSAKPEPDTPIAAASGAAADAQAAPRVPSGIAPPITSHSTAPGPPIGQLRDRTLSRNRLRPAALHRTETSSPSWSSSGASCNPFNVDLVLPFDISLKASKSKTYGRAQELAEIRDAYEVLVRALEGAGGLRIATKSPPVKRDKQGKFKPAEEVWVFVGVDESKMRELVQRERALDEAHNLPLRPLGPPSPATRIRLAHALLTSPEIQHGLGITPGSGRWSRVKSIAPLHDEERDREWVKSWSMGKGGDWQIGLWKGLNADTTGIAEHRTPPVHLYFDFLTTYTLSLLPLSILGGLFYLFSPSNSYPPVFALILSLYSTIFVSVWKIRERKLAVRWGYKGCENLAVGRLRPEYVANLGLDKGDVLGASARGEGSVKREGEAAVDVAMRGDALKRDAKGVLSVLVIALCGVGLGGVLMGIFVLEAFVSQVYEGPGKEVVALLPTALFSLVVPRIVGAFQQVAKLLVNWEDHATPGQAEKSLTAKTFAMNAIVAYLGLFLSAYVYVPFGPFIMANIQSYLDRFAGHSATIAESAEKAGLGPRTGGAKQHAIKAERLKGQLFAYTVTNQVINAFLELGLPYILRFIDDWRAGRATIKDALHGKANHATGEDVKRAEDADEAEKRFLEKVEFELSLPEYTTFTDYAEMVTQFGYIVVWSCVWPLAPVFALLNNYFEIRGDVVKITQHVRRPVGDRVETIGSWLDTLSILSWLGAVVSSTLIYLFRPSTHLHAQSPNPSVPATGNVHLHAIVNSYSASSTWRTVLPTLLPLIAVALAASHAHIALKWAVEHVLEKVLWRGSVEEGEVAKMSVRGTTGGGEGQGAKAAGTGEKERQRQSDVGSGGFWNGAEEGAREIARVGKVE